MKRFDNKSAIKTFYYLLAIDGIIAEEEMDKFYEIGKEIDPQEFDSYKYSIVSDCEKQIKGISGDEDYYEIIQESIDEIISKSEPDKYISTRLVIWNLLVIAYADSIYEEREKKLIRHIARITDLENSVLFEMEQLISTSLDVSKELEWLNQSDKSYAQIRPIVDEIEKRQANIASSVKALIEDEIYMESFSDSKISLNNTEEKASENENKKNNISNFFGKIKDATIYKRNIKLPTKYTLSKEKTNLDMEPHKDAVVYHMLNEMTDAFCACYEVAEKDAMPFDNADALILELHSTMSDNQGIIEVKNGVTTKGFPYIYSITKSSNDEGNMYSLIFNVKFENVIRCLKGVFIECGAIGIRESSIHEEMLKMNNEVDEKGIIIGWTEDPYNVDYTKGYLMNKSENTEFDKDYPQHALSEARTLVEFIVGTH